MNVGKRNLKILRIILQIENSRRLLSIASAFILILQAIGCNKENQDVTQPTEGVPQQTLQGFSTSHAEAGIMKWVLIGDKAKFFTDVVRVEHPTVQIFENGQAVSTITGKRGEIIKATNDIKVYDDVVGVSQNGKLYTDELHWLNRDGKLYAPNESTIVRGDSTMVGQELEGNPSLDVVTMKNIQFKLYTKDEKSDASKSPSSGREGNTQQSHP